MKFDKIKLVIPTEKDLYFKSFSKYIITIEDIDCVIDEDHYSLLNQSQYSFSYKRIIPSKTVIYGINKGNKNHLYYSDCIKPIVKNYLRYLKFKELLK